MILEQILSSSLFSCLPLISSVQSCDSYNTLIHVTSWKERNVESKLFKTRRERERHLRLRRKNGKRGKGAIRYFHGPCCTLVFSSSFSSVILVFPFRISSKSDTNFLNHFNLPVLLVVFSPLLPSTLQQQLFQVYQVNQKVIRLRNFYAISFFMKLTCENPSSQIHFFHFQMFLLRRNPSLPSGSLPMLCYVSVCHPFRFLFLLC